MVMAGIHRTIFLGLDLFPMVRSGQRDVHRDADLAQAHIRNGILLGATIYELGLNLS
jgi:hypothetical protein